MLSPAPSSNPKQPLFQQPAFRLAILYAIIAALWVIFSDLLTESIAPSRAAMELIEAVKGLVFVMVTTVGLYFMVRQREQVIARQKQEHQAQMDQYRLLLEAAGDFVVLIDRQ